MARFMFIDCLLIGAPKGKAGVVRVAGSERLVELASRVGPAWIVSSVIACSGRAARRSRIPRPAPRRTRAASADPGNPPEREPKPSYGAGVTIPSAPSWPPTETGTL